MIIATKVASVLVKRGRYRQAVELWTSLSMNNALPRRSVDLVSLTVLMKAYIGLSDCNGMKWVMDTLTQNDIIPDARFKLLVKRALRDARKSHEEQPGKENNRRRCDVLHHGLQLVLARRSQSLLMREEAERKTLHIMEIAAVVRANDTAAHTGSMAIASDSSCDESARVQQEVSVTVDTASLGLRDDLPPTWVKLDEQPYYANDKEMKPQLIGVAVA